MKLFMTEEKPPITSGSRVSRREEDKTTIESPEPRCKTSNTKSKFRGHRQSYFSQTQRQLNGNNYSITTYLSKG